MEAALRAISVNPETGIALQDSPGWKTLTEVLRFIGEAAVVTWRTSDDLSA
jgi:hypothetical protein